MKRPQSAKPGHKGYWGNSSMEDINEQQQKQPKKHAKIIKPDYTHDFGRILPRKIQQDKQRLYSQALQLKQNMNEVAEENVRLKTKISILQREKQKMNKMMETAPEGLGSKGSRLNVYQSRTYEKDNMIVRNLKKIVKEAREENDALKSDNQKIKKIMKYTKINELQIERKTIIEENKRLSAMLEEYSSQFVSQQEVEKQNEELKKYLQEQIEQRNQLQQEREKYEEIIESLEQKIKSENQRWQAKQKKIVRDFNLEKRRANELQRKNQDLMRQLKSIRQNQQFIEQRQKSSKTAIRVSNIQRNSKQSRFNTQQSDNVLEADKKISQLKNHNEQLVKQLQEIKEKLKKAEQQKLQLQDTINKKSQMSNQQEKELDHNPSSQIDKEQEDEQYEEEFDQEKTNKIDQSNKYEEAQIEKYKKNFEENQEQQQLFKQQEKPKKNKSNHKQKKQKKQKQKKPASAGGVYKPNKKILAQIKQLLTYRMKSQRYPFADIKSDIESAQTSTFSYLDLCNMFVNEPFYLTPEYTKAFLCYCFQKEKNEGSDAIPNAALVAKLRKVIDDFELMEENEEKEMIIRIAEMTSTYPRQLQVAFENIKNGDETVARKDLIEMFKKLELQDKYIQLIIAQLSLCSDDLQHLNFHGFFERFYIQEEGQDYLDNAIEEQGEESQQSRKHSSRVKKQAKPNKSVSDGEDEE